MSMNLPDTDLPDTNLPARTRLPIYRHAFDFERLIREYPLPDVFEETVWRWSPERIRAPQQERFLRTGSAMTQRLARGWPTRWQSA